MKMSGGLASAAVATPCQGLREAGLGGCWGWVEETKSQQQEKHGGGSRKYYIYRDAVTIVQVSFQIDI